MAKQLTNIERTQIFNLIGLYFVKDKDGKVDVKRMDGSRMVTIYSYYALAASISRIISNLTSQQIYRVRKILTANHPTKYLLQMIHILQIGHLVRYA